MIDDKQMQEALDRIARTPDGQLLYRYLQKVLCSMAADLGKSALRHHEGRRRFASELMGHMAEGISDSDRHAITFSVAGAKRVASARTGAGRRVTADTAVPGWDTPDTAGSDAGPGSASSQPS